MTHIFRERRAIPLSLSRSLSASYAMMTLQWRHYNDVTIHCISRSLRHHVDYRSFSYYSSVTSRPSSSTIAAVLYPIRSLTLRSIQLQTVTWFSSLWCPTGLWHFDTKFTILIEILVQQVLYRLWILPVSYLGDFSWCHWFLIPFSPS